MAEEKSAEVVLRSSMKTDVGVVREHNEDSAHVDEKNRFFVVADGMGGHAAGEVASAMAVEGVRKALDEADDLIKAYAEDPTEEGRQSIAQLLEGAVREAHRAVYDRGIAEPDKQGMGTTLDVLLVSGQEAFIAHVGDSRTYLMRGGNASQITTDHTVAEVLVIEGKLSAEEALVSPLRTILVNAIGVAPEVGVEMAHLTLRRGDRILLCSDGLHDYYPQNEELFAEVTTKSPDEAISTLVEGAKERGGHDNITGVVVEVLEAPDMARGPTQPIPILRPNKVPGEMGSDRNDPPANSDGVPNREMSRDDTLPVDVGEDTPPAPLRVGRGDTVDPESDTVEAERAVSENDLDTPESAAADAAANDEAQSESDEELARAKTPPIEGDEGESDDGEGEGDAGDDSDDD